jgi:hypothetical protein
MFLH